MYNTGWAKSRRALDCFFTFMAEILGWYWQILDRSGKKIILLLPLTDSHLKRYQPEVENFKQNINRKHNIFPTRWMKLSFRN